MLRRLLSISLFLATLLPLIAPVLSIGAMAQSSLPACCKRDGKHHCAMSVEDRAMLMGEDGGASKGVRVSAVCDMCPYRQTAMGAVHLQVYVAGVASTHTAGVVRLPSAVAQAECLRRISFDRSRQKRGPPTLLS